MLHPVSQLSKYVRGNVLGRLGHEEDADALRPDESDGLRDGSEEVFGRIVEDQVRLVEEEHELRLVDVADLGELLEQVRKQPHEERREECRPILQLRQFQ